MHLFECIIYELVLFLYRPLRRLSVELVNWFLGHPILQMIGTLMCREQQTICVLTCMNFFLDTDNTALVVGLGIPAVMLVLLLFTIVLLRRRKNMARRATENRASDNMSLPDSIIETRLVKFVYYLLILIPTF